jgi:hypothetical protein
MSTIDRIGIRRVDVERTTAISAQPFDVVVSKLLADLEAVANAAIGARFGAPRSIHFPRLACSACS